MRVAITGATGLIGSALAGSLRADGHQAIGIGRGASSDVRWNPATGEIESAKLEGIDAIVNLAGATIGRRWTASRKREIRESRTRGTSLLARALSAMTRPPAVLLSGSAMGYYGDRGDEQLDESSSAGSDFLASVTRDWEQAALEAESPATRVVLLRTGLVLSKSGGALPKMLLPFRFGVGGPVGNGRQWMSWIALADHVRAMRFLLEHELRGAVNLVAPAPVTNEEFARTLGRVISRPRFFRVPEVGVRLVFGEMGPATLLASQRIVPLRLERAGFTFAHPTLENALRHELSVGRR